MKQKKVNRKSGLAKIIILILFLPIFSGFILPASAINQSLSVALSDGSHDAHYYTATHVFDATNAQLQIQASSDVISQINFIDYGIPANATIMSAYLWYNVPAEQGSSSAYPRSATIYGIEDNSLSNLTSVDDMVTGVYTTSHSEINLQHLTAGNHSVEVTEIVRELYYPNTAWPGATGDLGFVILGSAYSASRYFSSYEGGTPMWLVINYYLPTSSYYDTYRGYDIYTTAAGGTSYSIANGVDVAGSMNVTSWNITGNLAQTPITVSPDTGYTSATQQGNMDLIDINGTLYHLARTDGDLTVLNLLNSTDNGQTWSILYEVYDHSAAIEDYSLVWQDSLNTIHVAYSIQTALYYENVTYSGGSWTPSHDSVIGLQIDSLATTSVNIIVDSTYVLIGSSTGATPRPRVYRQSHPIQNATWQEANLNIYTSTMNYPFAYNGTYFMAFEDNAGDFIRVFEFNNSGIWSNDPDWYLVTTFTSATDMYSNGLAKIGGYDHWFLSGSDLRTGDDEPRFWVVNMTDTSVDDYYINSTETDMSFQFPLMYEFNDTAHMVVAAWCSDTSDNGIYDFPFSEFTTTLGGNTIASLEAHRVYDQVTPQIEMASTLVDPGITGSGGYAVYDENGNTIWSGDNLDDAYDYIDDLLHDDYYQDGGYMIHLDLMIGVIGSLIIMGSIYMAITASQAGDLASMIYYIAVGIPVGYALIIFWIGG